MVRGINFSKEDFDVVIFAFFVRTGNDGTSITHQFLSQVLSTLGIMYMAGAGTDSFFLNVK